MLKGGIPELILMARGSMSDILLLDEFALFRSLHMCIHVHVGGKAGKKAVWRCLVDLKTKPH